MTRRRPRLLAALAALALSIGIGSAASPAVAGTDDFVFESLDVQYYLDRDAGGHSTLTTIETFVAVFPDYDQNRGIVRNIPITYGGTDAYDPRRVDTGLEIVSVTGRSAIAVACSPVSGRPNWTLGRPAPQCQYPASTLRSATNWATPHSNGKRHDARAERPPDERQRRRNASS